MVIRRGLQALGAALLVLAFAPIYRLVDTSGEAGYRETAVVAAQAALGYGLWGTVLTVLLGLVLAVLLPTDRLRRAVAAAAQRITRLPLRLWAAALALLSALLAAAVAHLLYRGLLTNVDEMASTLQARYLAHGMLGGPTPGGAEFWLIPNTLVAAEGLVSQYPPAHLYALAAGELLGLPTLVGPLCFGLTTALLALAFPRLLPRRPATARVAALLVALSPFLLFLAGGALNHVSTGALLAGVLYAALRARDGRVGWSVAAGTAVGLAVADRPLTGLVLGTLLTLGVWVTPTLERGWRWLAGRCLGTIAGGAPVALFLGWYNARLFGSPWTLGYLAAFGERHGLGFHQDPWGYAYGIVEAVGLTSVDVVIVGVQLLETPLPVVALVGTYLLEGQRLERGVGVLLAWALLPVFANAFYWFHSGRLLYEAAPAWLALAAIAAVELGGRRAGSGEGGGGRAGPLPTHRLGSAAAARWRALGRDTAAWAALVAVAGALAVGVPDRWRSYRWDPETLDRITVPEPPAGRPAIVFVHTSWNERTSAILQGAGGMRQDTVITALRRNTSCGLHRYAAARAAGLRDGGAVTLPEVDLRQLPGAAPEIRVVPLAAGGTARVRDGEPFDADCLRELGADRFGTVALAPLLWQGDLPGIEDGRPIFARDFGPERNAALLAAYPERMPFAFVPIVVGGAPELVPYAEAMAILWPAPPAGVPGPEAPGV